MSREEQKRLLTELNRLGLAWMTTPSHETQGQTALRWLPVTNLAAPRIQLGLSSDARWVRATSASVTEFTEDKTCVFLLPVLEIALDEAKRLLAQGLQARGLSAEFLAAFPFESVVAEGLKSHSEHWTSLALKWAEQLPASTKLQSALHSLASSGPTQKLRHAAWKMLARQRESCSL